MPEITPAVLSEPQAARHVGIGVTSLRNRRYAGKLPPGLCVWPTEHRLVYPVALLNRWVQLGCPDAWPAGEPRLAG